MTKSHARSLGTTLLTLPLLAILACEPGAEQYTPEPNVYCLLRPDLGATTVLCGMTVGYYDSLPDPRRWNGTAGVDVRIRHNGAEFICPAVPDSTGCYVSESLPVIPRDSYELAVRYPDGSIVTGATTVPDTFSMTVVRIDTARPEYGPPDQPADLVFTLRWTRSTGATEYLVQADGWYGSEEESLFWRDGPYMPGSSRETDVRLPMLYFKDEGDTAMLGRARLVIWAIDRNYRDYHLLPWNPDPTSEDLIHLAGGVGVFGSAVLAETTLYFTPPR